MRSCVIDIEATGLPKDMIDFSSLPYGLLKSAKIWVVSVEDVETGETFTAEKENITRDWLDKTLKPYHYIIAHNGMKYDFPMLMLFDLWDYSVAYMGGYDTLNGRDARFVDTAILSRLSNPDRLGGHSLEVWGKRVGEYKTDYREQCILAGYIEKSSPKGAEFWQFNPLMTPYCQQDCKSNVVVYKEILKEMSDYDGWRNAIRQEHKLADLAIRRELFGFAFDKEAAVLAVEDLTDKMNTLANRVNPILPKRKLNKTEENSYTPPKSQIKKDGTYTESFKRFLERTNSEIIGDQLLFEEKLYDIPLPQEPLMTETDSTIDDMDTVKSYLIELGWEPSEWRERDLTKDSKKQNLSIEKRVAALDRWFSETMRGKYKKNRLDILGLSEGKLYDTLRKKLNDNKPVRVPTSPSVRVGVEKELCPSLIELGDKVSFAKDFADYLTYRHRKSSIAGGDVDDMDFDEESPNTGYLSMYREVDGRIATPAIEIGASTNRYKHIGVANIPRATSMYGKEMRSLFGCGEGFVQLGFDFSSLENRIQGSYVFNGTEGELLAERLIADKPFDLHTINAEKLGITRTDAKSFTYAILYGASPKKVAKMLKCSMERAEELVNEFWNAVPALKELKQDKEREWLSTGKKYIIGIDGRKINIRSQHSILNALFQSGGVICAKYVNILLVEKLEKLGYNIDCLKGKPDVAEMISYHDEEALAVRQDLIKYKTFKTEEEGKDFIKNWQGSQLSELNNVKTWYVALPNVVSEKIIDSVKEVGEMLNLNVPLGIGWAVGKNWYQTH